MTIVDRLYHVCLLFLLNISFNLTVPLSDGIETGTWLYSEKYKEMKKHLEVIFWCETHPVHDMACPFLLFLSDVHQAGSDVIRMHVRPFTCDFSSNHFLIFSTLTSGHIRGTQDELIRLQMKPCGL